MIRGLLVTLLAAGCGFAQLSTGSIVGTVKDPSGLATAGVAITAKHLATGRARQTTTNERGDFVITSLEPGGYTLSFAMSGFKKKELENVLLIQLPAVGTFGNAARSVIRGPGINNWDMALVKNVPIRERLRLQLRWEAYNAFNHTQFSTINTSANFNPANGQQINAQFGAFTAARDPRQMQIAARLTF